MDWLWIAGGLVALIAAADLLVRGAVWCALAMGISPMMVGLTLVAFGTSAPELFVSLTAALEDKPGFATGSVLGSNIANIGLIVGTAALMKPIVHRSGSAKFEIRFLILTAAVIFVPLTMATPIQRVHGMALLGLLLLFTLLLIRRESRRRAAVRAAPPGGEVPSTIRRGTGQVILHAGMVVVGLVGLKFGGDWLVLGASGLARGLGLSETLIGMTVIAVGTSLPELATSVVAARKGHPEIALGNVLGSNVFNTCMVLGAASMVAPLPLSWPEEGRAAAVGLAMAILLGLTLRYAGGVGRRFGLLLLLGYVGYVAAAILTRPAGT